MKKIESTPTVLFLCNYQAPYSGNFIASLRELEKSLTIRGYNCVYLFPIGAADREWLQYLKKQECKIEMFDFTQPLIKKIKHLKKVINKHQIVLIHTHFGENFTSAICGFGKRDIKVIWHIHSDFSLGKKRKGLREWKIKVKRWLKYNLIGRSVSKIAVSQGLTYKIHNITYVPNGIPQERVYRLTKESKTVNRAKNGIGTEKFLILLFSWDPIVKGADIAVQAFKELHNRGREEFELGLVYGHQYTEEKLRYYVQENTGCTGYESYLHFLPPLEDVFIYHGIADAMLSASRSEGFSYSLLEALSLGNPCVVSDIPGVKWCKDFKNVITFETESVIGCVQALELLYEKMKCNDFKLLCYDEASRCEERYSIDLWVREILKVYGLL